MDGKSALLEAITSVPVPGAPPRFSRDDAAIGLSFLDSALRLDHVRRLTERLTIVEHRAARRRTEVDIDLRGLDDARRHPADPYPRRPTTVWVPVSRISRRAVVPVDVYDAAGVRLPRLSQREVSRLLAAGLYRLLHGILASHPDAREESLLGELLYEAHESRWLIQLALASLLTDQHRPEPHRRAEASGDAVSGQGARHRKLALKVFEEYADPLVEYFALFDVAVNEHLLIVPLDARRDEHLVTYDMPLYAHRDEGRGGRLTRMLRSSAEGYRVRYDGVVSSGVRSYQLELETDPGVHIERLYLSTTADERLVVELRGDLTVLAERLAAFQAGPVDHDADPEDRAPAKILELQTQTSLRRLADLVRRREWDAEHADVALPATLRTCLALTRVVVAGEGGEADEHGGDSSILRHPSLSPAALSAAADELARGEAHRDLSVERDPESNRAHASWRSPGSEGDGSAQVGFEAAALLRDTTAQGPRSVRLYGLAVAAMGYVVACFLTDRFWPFGGAAAAALADIDDADAVIAVLLLVPGFLYTRLSLPDHQSVTGQLRALSRLVANACIGAVALVAAAVAAGLPGAVVQAALGVMIVVPLLGSALLRVRRGARVATAELVRLGAPAWLHEGDVRKAPLDAQFSSIGNEW